MIVTTTDGLYFSTQLLREAYFWGVPKRLSRALGVLRCEEEGDLHWGDLAFLQRKLPFHEALLLVRCSAPRPGDVGSTKSGKRLLNPESNRNVVPPSGFEQKKIRQTTLSALPGSVLSRYVSNRVQRKSMNSEVRANPTKSSKRRCQAKARQSKTNGQHTNRRRNH